MPGPNFQPTSTLDSLDALDFQDNLNDGLNQVQFAGALTPAIRGIRSLAQQWMSSGPRPLNPSSQPIEVTPKQDPQPIQTVDQLQQATYGTQLSPPNTQSSDTTGAPLPSAGAAPASAPAGSTGPAGAPSPAAVPSGQAPASAPLTQLDTSSGDANLKGWAPALQDVERRTGLRADALAGIIAAENGGGQSTLSAGQNNYFSISNVGRPNQVQGADGRFATYATPQDSLNDFVDLIQNDPRYADAWANRGDPQKFVQGLIKGGYIADEPGFPISNWTQNIESGRQRYNGLAPQPAASGAAQAQPSAMPSGQAPSDSASTDVSQAALDDPDKWVLCGPVAAVIAAGRRGANWTVAQAKQISQAANLWDASQGMHGLQSEVDLLNKMNVPARTGAADAQTLISEAQSGNTPIVSTPNHYFVLTGYDPTTGTFDTTTTGGVYKAGARRMTLDQIERVGGGIQGAAYMDNPSSPTPSVVAGQSAPVADAQGGPPWTQTSTGTAPTSSAQSAATDTSTPASPLMLRQPLNAPTPGADSTPTWQDSQTEPAQVQPGVPTDTDPAPGRFIAEPLIMGTDAATSPTIPGSPFPPPPGAPNQAVPGYVNERPWNPEDGPLPTGENMPPINPNATVLYRQPINAPTSGADTFPTDASSPSGGVSDALAAPGSVAPTSPSGAGAFQDDQTQSGWTPPAALMSQTVPNEDSTTQAPPSLTDSNSTAQPSLGQRIQQAGSTIAAGLVPVLDAAGNVISYIDHGVQSAATTVAQEGIATPIARGIANTVVRPALGMEPLPDTGQPDPSSYIDRALVTTGQSIGQDIQGIQSGTTKGIGLGVLGLAGDLAPTTTLARQLNEMFPKADLPVLGETGVGDVVMDAQLAHDAYRLGYGTIQAGGRVWSTIADAVRNGVTADDFSAWANPPSAIDNGVSSLTHAPDPAGAPNAGIWFSKPDATPFTPEEVQQTQAALAQRGIQAHLGADGATIVIPAHDAPPGFVNHVTDAVQEVGYGPEALTSYAGETSPQVAGDRPAGALASGNQPGEANGPQVSERGAGPVGATAADASDTGQAGDNAGGVGQPAPEADALRQRGQDAAPSDQGNGNGGLQPGPEPTAGPVVAPQRAMENALPSEGGTIGRGGAPMEKPPIWTTQSTADAFDPQWAPPGFLEQAGIPTEAPRRPNADTYVYHLTPAENVPSAAERGLQAGAGDARPTDIVLPDGSRATRKPLIYAADNAGILSTVDRDYPGTADWALMRFPRGNRRWLRDPEFATDPGSWMTRNSIPPSDIEVYTGNEWRPIQDVIPPRGEPPGAARPMENALPSDRENAALEAMRRQMGIESVADRTARLAAEREAGVPKVYGYRRPSDPSSGLVELKPGDPGYAFKLRQAQQRAAQLKAIADRNMRNLPNALPDTASAPSIGPALRGASAAAPARALIGAGVGGVAGAVTGYQTAPDDATPGERLARTAAGGAAGVGLGSTLALTGTVAAGHLLDSLIERGAVNPRLLASHPETADRIRALFAVAAHGLPDDAVVPVPAMASALANLKPRAAQGLEDLLGGTATAGQVRQIAGDANNPGVVQTVKEMVADAMSGLNSRGQRARETAADTATVNGIPQSWKDAAGPAIGPAASALDTAHGPAPRLDPAKSPNLSSFVNETADNLGVARPDVYVAPSSNANASATVVNGRPALVLTRGMLRSRLTDDEMAAVLTHELAHIAQPQGVLSRATNAVNDAFNNAVGGGGRGMQNALGAEPREGEPNRAVAVGSDPSKPYEFRYRVADLGDLVPSNLPNGAANPAFPRELQPRDRGRAASQLQIDQIAKGLSPDALLTDVGRLDSGPPIVGGDNVVESGNGRTLALRRAAEQYPEQYQAYVDQLRGNLGDYGLSPSDLRGVKQPVLVRERVTPVDRPAFAAEANNAGLLRMSSFEQAAQDAGNLRDDVVTGMRVGENDTIATALRHPDNRDLVRGWVATLPANERAAVLDVSGNLSAQGYERLTNALLVRTYGAGAGERLAQTFIESADPTVRNVQGALMASLPDVARAEALVRSGQRDASLSIADDVAAATEMLARLRRDGTSVSDHLAQTSFMGRELTPAQEDILRFLDQNTRRPAVIRDTLREYANGVENAADPNQAGMFGGEIAPVSREEIWRNATAAADQQAATRTAARRARPNGSGLAQPGPESLSPASDIVPATGGPAGSLAVEGAPDPVARPGAIPEGAAPTGGPEGSLSVQGAPTAPAQPGALPANPAPTGGPQGTLAVQGAPQPTPRPGPIPANAAPAGGPAGTLAAPGAPTPLRPANLPPVGPNAAPTGGPHLPLQVQQAVQQAQAQQKPGLSPLAWMRKLGATIGNSSMLGPTTGSFKLAGDLMQAAWAAPKELTRGAVRAVQTGNRAALREGPQYIASSLYGISQAGSEIVDALAARGHYANPDSLSAQTNNPLGKALAVGLEAGNRLFIGVPDALFSTVATYGGEAREAAQIATNKGLTGSAWQADVNNTLAAVRAVKAGTARPTADAIQTIKAGQEFTQRQTFKSPLGGIGKGVHNWATISVIPDGKGGVKPIPVVGNLVSPYFRTPWNMNLRMAERSPLGLTMNSQGGRFDKVYDAAVGSAILAGVAAGPVASGLVTGSGPSDPQKLSEMRLLGWRPYSMLIHGTYVPTRAAGIYAPMLNAAADVHDAMVYSKDQSPTGIAADYAGRLGAQLKEQPYLKGVSDLLSLLGNPTAGGVQDYASSAATRMVPYASTARAIGTAMDPSDRTVDRGKSVPASQTIGEQIRQGIGNRQGFASLGQQPLPVSQNVLGQPQENQQQGVKSIFAKTSEQRAQPIIQGFVDSGVDIPSVPNTMNISQLDIPMTPDQRRQWQTERGDALTRIAAPTILNNTMKDFAPARRAAILHQFLDAASKQADGRVWNSLPPDERARLINEAVATKQQKAS